MAKKKGFATGMAALLVLAMATPTMAASTISSVTLELEYDIYVGDYDSDVSVSSDSSKYDVEDYEITNEPDDGWEDGDKPKVKVTLTTDEDDYKFASGFSKSDVDLEGDDGTVTAVSRKSSSELVITITLPALDEDDVDEDDDDEDDDDDGYDLDIDSLEWDYEDGIAYWDESSDARKYEVRLYRDGSSVTSALTTSDNEYDFSEYFTKSGEYTFKVRAVYSSSNKGSWEESEGWDVTSSEAKEIRTNSSSSGSSSKSSAVTAGAGEAGPGSTSSAPTETPAVDVSSDDSSSDSANAGGAWLQNEVGWWYIRTDRTYPANEWAKINDAWYYFDGNGYMVTGWLESDGNWYYLDTSGALLTDATTPDGYYVDANGIWVQ